MTSRDPAFVASLAPTRALTRILFEGFIQTRLADLPVVGRKVPP